MLQELQVCLHPLLYTADYNRGVGLVGSKVVAQLIEAGHTVVGLARSDAFAAKLAAAGATSAKGTHTSLDVLKQQSEQADAVIHCAFNHEAAFSGGAAQAYEEDRVAIKTMCDALKGKIFVNSSGVLAVVGEDETCRSEPNFPRTASEEMVLSYASKGVRTVNIRLPPVVYGEGQDHPFIATQIATAKKLGFAAFIVRVCSRIQCLQRLTVCLGRGRSNLVCS